MLQNLTTLFQIIKIHKPPHNFAPFIAKTKMHTHKEKNKKLTKPNTPKSHELQHSTPNLNAKTLVNLMTTTPNHKSATFFSIQDITYSQASF
jgi:hypothetical protein